MKPVRVSDNLTDKGRLSQTVDPETEKAEIILGIKIICLHILIKVKCTCITRLIRFFYSCILVTVDWRWFCALHISCVVKTQMLSLMGCAIVRVQPQQMVADHAAKPETARQHSMTSPAVSSVRQDKSVVNGTADGSKNSVEAKTQQPGNSSRRETESHVATCSSHNQPPAAQVRIKKQHRFCTHLFIYYESRTKVHTKRL